MTVTNNDAVVYIIGGIVVFVLQIVGFRLYRGWSTMSLSWGLACGMAWICAGAFRQAQFAPVGIVLFAVWAYLRVPEGLRNGKMRK